MEARIRQTKTRFTNAIRSSEFSTLTNSQVFYTANKLLDKLLEQSSNLTEEEILNQYYAIVFGTVICALKFELDDGGLKRVKVHDKTFGFKGNSLGTLHADWMNIYDNSGLAMKESELITWTEKFIPIVGHEALFRKALPIDKNSFKEDSRLGEIISEAIPEEEFKEHQLYCHKQLYLKAYQDQERGHRRRRNAGIALAVFATIIPLLSLVVTIPFLVKHYQSDSSGPHEWFKFALKSLVALICPIYSGRVIWEMTKFDEKRNRSDDRIKKSTWTKKEWEDEKSARSKAKTAAWPGVDWKAIRNPKKPKKVLVPYENARGAIMLEVYQDREREEYRSSQAISNNLLSNSPDTLFNSYKSSQAHSVRIVEQLENEYASLRRMR